MGIGCVKIGSRTVADMPSLDLAHIVTYLGTAAASAGSTWLGMRSDIKTLKRTVAVQGQRLKAVEDQSDRISRLAAEIVDIRAGNTKLHTRVEDLEEEDATGSARAPMPSINDEDLAAKVERFVTRKSRVLWAEFRELQREFAAFRNAAETQRTSNAENWASLKASVVAFEKQLEQILSHLLNGR